MFNEEKTTIMKSKVFAPGQEAISHSNQAGVQSLLDGMEIEFGLGAASGWDGPLVLLVGGERALEVTPGRQ